MGEKTKLWQDPACKPTSRCHSPVQSQFLLFDLGLHVRRQGHRCGLDEDATTAVWWYSQPEKILSFRVLVAGTAKQGNLSWLWAHHCSGLSVVGICAANNDGILWLRCSGVLPSFYFETVAQNVAHNLIQAWLFSKFLAHFHYQQCPHFGHPHVVFIITTWSVTSWRQA